MGNEPVGSGYDPSWAEPPPRAGVPPSAEPEAYESHLPGFEHMWADLAPVGRSAATGGYFRQPFTSADSELRAWFVAQATERGLDLSPDQFGNLTAWWRPGSVAAETAGVLVGSHLDSVLDGGAYDGPLGIVSAFAALDQLRAAHFTPTRPVGISVFVEEEGSRFGVACLGSRLATGSLTWGEAQELRDRDGVWLADAMAQAGLTPQPDSSPPARHQPGQAHPGQPQPGQPQPGQPQRGQPQPIRPAYFVELHIEQGRDLAHRDQPIGLASGIWPHGRYRFEFVGEANHAGTTNAEDRHDPMLTFSVTALAAAKLARLRGQRATFGRVEVAPNSTNTVPRQVTAWLDARCDTDQAQAALVAEIKRHADTRAERDGTTVRLTTESVSGPVEFPAGLANRLAALGQHGPWPILPTQAGHDAGVMAQAGVPTAMLFVRNPTGVSHAPSEHADVADCLHGVNALAATIAELAGEQ